MLELRTPLPSVLKGESMRCGTVPRMELCRIFRGQQQPPLWLWRANDTLESFSSTSIKLRARHDELRMQHEQVARVSATWHDEAWRQHVDCSCFREWLHQPGPEA